MEIIAGTTDFYLEKDTAVAIGKFDGVHLGHRRLLEEILNKKKNGLAACVFTFDPTPAVLFGLSDGKELTTREEKRRLFERLGIDILIEFPLTKETAATEPERFVTEILAKQMNTRFVAAGEDLSFGKNGAGNAELLEKMAPQLGFCVRTIEKIEVDGIEVSFSGEHNTLIVQNQDSPGHVVAVASALAERGVNIATMQLYRSGIGGRAVMVLECDEAISPEAAEELSGIDGIEKVTVLNQEGKQ